MEYTVIVNERSYELPKKTLKVAEDLDKVLKVDSTKGLSVRQKFERLHDFMKETVGEENAREMFGTDDIDKIDLSELTLAVKKVATAYEKPIEDYDVEQRRAMFANLPLTQISTLTNAANTVASVNRGIK